MRRYTLLLLLTFCISAVHADQQKGTVITLDGVKSAAPAEWKEEAVGNAMRLAQFKLPKAKGDDYDAEIVIFQNLGGTAKQNIDRWKGQFTPPEGKTIGDVSKVTETKVGGYAATMLDVTGTYTMKTRPFDPNDKGVKRAEYRLIALQVDGPAKPYHIRLVGPEKTVEQYKKGFEEWLKNFK